MAVPIYLQPVRNPFLSQAPSILANLIMQKSAQNFQREEGARQRTASQQRDAANMAFTAAMSGRDVVRTDAQKPPEGYSQVPGDPTTFVGPASVKPITFGGRTVGYQVGDKFVKSDKPMKPPTTAMAAFLRSNPNASPDEIAAYANKLKGKGFKMTLADGSVVEFGGAQTDLTTAAQSQLQKDTIDLMGRINELEALGEDVFKEALTMQGQVKGKVLRFKDWLNMPLSEENKEFLGKTRAFKEGLEQTFNQYRKEITGAQAAIKELNMLRETILNKKLTPTEFEYSYNRYMDQMKRSLRLKRMLLRQGIEDPKRLGQAIDRAFVSGIDVPDSEIDARGNELKNKGLTDDMVIKQLTIEGYLE